MGFKILKQFKMDWCLVWNTVYEGSIASAVHMMISSLVYVAMTAAIIYYARYYAGPEGVELGNEYREIIRHGDQLFSAGHEKADGDQEVHTFADARVWLKEKTRNGELAAAMTSKVPNWIQRVLDAAKRSRGQLDGEEHQEEGDGHDTEEPLLSPTNRDKLLVPSTAMLGFSIINTFLSVILFISIHVKNVFFLLLWSIIVLPATVIADNTYQIYLFYLLLNMEPLWAHTGSTWFEIFVVANFIMWIVRNLCNLYTFFCITAFRNASTQRRKAEFEQESPARKRLRVSMSGESMVENGLPPAAVINVNIARPSDDGSTASSTSSAEESEQSSSLSPGHTNTIPSVLARNGLLRPSSGLNWQEREHLLTEEETLKIARRHPSFFYDNSMVPDFVKN